MTHVRASMAWKMYLFSNMAILGIYVSFQGCRGTNQTQNSDPGFVLKKENAWKVFNSLVQAQQWTQRGVQKGLLR